MPASKTKNLKPKTTAPKTVSKPAAVRSKFSVPVYDLSGKKKGSVELPKESFGAKINDKLMAQAVRVYLANQKQGTASTKTRGEVTGSTRKIYRQKGTGRARHGSIKAPIFVGGGIVFGPRPGKHDLKLSQTLRRKALLSALTQKLIDQKVIVVDAKDAQGKTKEFASMLKNLNLSSGKGGNLVLYVSDSNALAKRAIKNIEGITVTNAESINTYEVLSNKHLVFEKSTILNLASTKEAPKL